DWCAHPTLDYADPSLGATTAQARRNLSRASRERARVTGAGRSPVWPEVFSFLDTRQRMRAVATGRAVRALGSLVGVKPGVAGEGGGGGESERGVARFGWEGGGRGAGAVGGRMRPKARWRGSRRAGVRRWVAGGPPRSQSWKASIGPLTLSGSPSLRMMARM